MLWARWRDCSRGLPPVLARQYTSAAVASSSQPLLGGAALSAGLSDGARRQLAWWVGGSAAWVYTMVVLGGVTRLTKSGLSMTDWKFSGERAPRCQADWDAEFAKYQASPEFQKLHRNMTLGEFQFIYYMEYAHRMWGRLLGLAFAGPAAYFAYRGYINGALGRRLGLLFLMGGTQGLVGWWMVRSGLQLENEHDTPRVSPYRLAAHLVSAFTIYAMLAWTAADLAYPHSALQRAAAASVAAASSGSAVASRQLRGALLPLAALVAVTATSGAFVAGMDAGRAYNTYPLMNGQWIPDEYWNPLTPGIRNFFENTAAVQFHHRALAAATAASVAGVWLWGRSKLRPLPIFARRGLDALAVVTATQFALGIYTLLQYVPPHLGSLHQANALNLFTVVVLTLHTLRPAGPASPTWAALQRFSGPAVLAGVVAIAVAVTQTK